MTKYGRAKCQMSRLSLLLSLQQNQNVAIKCIKIRVSVFVITAVYEGVCVLIGNRGTIIGGNTQYQINNQMESNNYDVKEEAKQNKNPPLRKFK